MDGYLDELASDQDLIHNLSLLIRKYRTANLIVLVVFFMVGVLLSLGVYFLAWYLVFIPLPVMMIIYLFIYRRIRSKAHHEYQNILLNRIAKKCFGMDSIYQEETNQENETESENYLNLIHLSKSQYFEGIFQGRPFEAFHLKAEFGLGGETTIIHDYELEANEINVKGKFSVKGSLIITSLPLKQNSLHHIYVDNMAFSQVFSVFTDNTDNKALLNDAFLMRFLALNRIFFQSRIFVLIKENRLECIIESENHFKNVSIYKPLALNIYALYDRYLSYIEKALTTIEQ